MRHHQASELPPLQLPLHFPPSLGVIHIHRQLLLFLCRAHANLRFGTKKIEETHVSSILHSDFAGLARNQIPTRPGLNQE
jgi:hypothetical protein